MNGRPFTDDEDRVIRDRTKDVAAIALELDRSVQSVTSRRHRLERASREPGRDIDGAMRIPKGHGSWLLAKTCLRCGALFPASAFKRRSDGGRDSYCTPCHSERALERREDDIAAWDRGVHRRQRETQAITADRARNNRKEWTGPELETVMRRDLSDKQKAEMLGRSFYAVRHIIRKIRNGDTAKVNLAGLPSGSDG